MFFSLNSKLTRLLYMQGFKENPSAWASLGTSGHIGVDLSRGNGSPVLALYGGTVVYRDDTGGTVVYLTDGDDCLELSHSHMKNIVVNVGDRVVIGQTIGFQNSHGPTMWSNEGDKIQWSHEHFNIREARRTQERKSQTLKWNFPAFSPIPYEVKEYDSTIDHFRNPVLYNQKVIDTFIKGIAAKEGFTNKTSRIAVECNNPGNLRWSPLQDGSENYGTPERPNIFAYFSTLEKGWEALRNDIKIKANGRSAHLRPGATILDFTKIYAPPEDHNDSKKYAQDLVDYCGLRSINDPLSDILLTELEWIAKYQRVWLGWFGFTSSPAFAALGNSFRLLFNTLYGRK